jgi:hypothetical protein
MEIVKAGDKSLLRSKQEKVHHMNGSHPEPRSSLRRKENIWK